MRCGAVRSPIIQKPTKVNATYAPPHTNFADEQILGQTCGFLNGTGYLDERLLPGSNVLRHKLPPVKLRRTTSAPGLREDDFQILAQMKAVEGVLGAKGGRLVGRLRENVVREKVDVAFAEGDMKALRGAVRAAEYGSKLHKDPQVQRVKAIVRKYEKCLIECRDGLAKSDMIRVQMAMDQLAELAEQGLGPRKMDNPILMDAHTALSKWAPFRPYLHKMGMMLLAGPRPYAQYWMVVVEGTLLSAELEASATSDLARFGQAGAEALEEALAVPTLRFHYDVPWLQKNPLPQQVRASLAKLGMDVVGLNMRIVRERAAEGWPQPDSTASVVISGPAHMLRAISELVAGNPGEPLAAGRPAVSDTTEKHNMRLANHRKRLGGAMMALEDAEAAAALDSQGPSLVLSEGGVSGGSMGSRSSLRARRLKQDPPTRGPWNGPNMFTKTF